MIKLYVVGASLAISLLGAGRVAAQTPSPAGQTVHYPPGSTPPPLQIAPPRPGKRTTPCATPPPLGSSRELLDAGIVNDVIGQINAGQAQAVLQHIEELRDVLSCAPEVTGLVQGEALVDDPLGQAHAIYATVMTSAEISRNSRRDNVAWTYPQTALLLGLTYVGLHDWANADKVLAKGLAIDPTSAILAAMDAVTLMSLDRMEDAIAVDDCALHGGAVIEPRLHATLLFLKGVAENRLHRTGAAMADFREALTFSPDDQAIKDAAANLAAQQIQAGH